MFRCVAVSFADLQQIRCIAVALPPPIVGRLADTLAFEHRSPPCPRADREQPAEPLGQDEGHERCLSPTSASTLPREADRNQPAEPQRGTRVKTTNDAIEKQATADLLPLNLLPTAFPSEEGSSFLEAPWRARPTVAGPVLTRLGGRT